MTCRSKGIQLVRQLEPEKRGVEKLFQLNIIVYSLLRSDTMLILEFFKRVKKNVL